MRYRVIIETDEDGVFVATVPALPGRVSDGRTRAEAIENVKEAIAAYLESVLKAGDGLVSVQDMPSSVRHAHLSGASRRLSFLVPMICVAVSLLNVSCGQRAGARSALGTSGRSEATKGLAGQTKPVALNPIERNYLEGVFEYMGDLREGVNRLFAVHEAVMTDRATDSDFTAEALRFGMTERMSWGLNMGNGATPVPARFAGLHEDLQRLHVKADQYISAVTSGAMRVQMSVATSSDVDSINQASVELNDALVTVTDEISALVP